MKKILFFVCFVFTSFSLTFSQENLAESIVGKEVLIDKKAHRYHPLYLEDGCAVWLSNVTDKRLQVVYYDDELQRQPEVHTIFYNDGLKGKNKLTLLNADFTSNNEVFVVFKQTDKNERVQKILANFIDLNSGKFQRSTHKLITEIPINHDIETYRLVNNQNRDLFLLEYFIRPQKSSRILTANYIVFNSETELVWKGQNQHDYIFTKFYSSSALITNNGKVISFTNIKDGKGKSVKNNSEKDVLNVEIFSDNGDPEKTFILKMKENQFLSGFKVVADKNNNIYFGGTYSVDEIPKYGTLSDGIINFSFNTEDTEVPDYKLNKLEGEVITKYRSEKSKNKIEEELSKGTNNVFYITVKNIIPVKDGYFLISLKDINYNLHTNAGNIRVYRSDDFLISFFDKSGDKQWEDKIPWFRESSIDGFFKFHFLLHEESLALVAVDDEKNYINFEDVKKGIKSRNISHLTIQKLDNDLQLYRELLVSFKEYKLGDYHYTATGSNQKEVVFFFLRGSKLRAVKISISE